MANKLRLKVTDNLGISIYIPNSSGQTFTVKTTFESSTIDISALATGLATISIEGYQDSVGFYRGVVVTGKSKNDHIIVSTLIGSMGFNLTGETGWVGIDSFKFYIYADMLNMNASLTYDVIPI